MTRTAHRRLLPIFLMILAVASLGLAACQAAMKTKQGALGEFCNNRDSDCRPGMICQDSVCVLANPQITDACQQVCDKINNCALAERTNCINDCTNEIENWGDSVINTFSQCVVSDLTCSELGSTANDAAQTCYDRLPLDEQRVQRCRDFVNQIESCRPNADTSSFQSDCIYRARTASADTWSKTDQCADAAQFGDCEQTVSCVNDVFQIPTDQQF